MKTPRSSLLSLLTLVLLLTQACSARDPGGPVSLEDEFPRTYGEIAKRRRDLAPIAERTRKAMGGAFGEGEPDGGLSHVITLDRRVYLPDEPVYLTVLWVNNTDRPIRVCRRLFLEANFRPLVFLDDKVQVLVNVAQIPQPPRQALKEADFQVIPPFGEVSLVVDLKDLPRFGLDAGANVRWSYNVSRTGDYKLRIGMRSVPRQLLPESLRGDPTAVAWEGSTLSNLVEFAVRRRR